MRWALSSVFDPQFFLLFNLFTIPHLIHKPRKHTGRKATMPRVRGDIAKFICIRTRHFPFKLHAKIQLLPPHLKHSFCSPQRYNATMLTITITTRLLRHISVCNAYHNHTSPKNPHNNLRPQLHHKHHSYDHLSLISSPLMPQHLSHLPITVATAINSLDAHHSFGGYRRNEDNENWGVLACNSKCKRALGFIRRRTDSFGVSSNNHA